MHIQFTIKQLINTGIHLGSSVTNNKIPTSYLFAQNNGYSIFDLGQTYFLLRRMLAFVENLSFRKGTLLFTSITPSRSIQRLTYMIAKKSYQYSYVSARWEGGILSNWREISLKRFKQFTDSRLVYKKYIGKVERRNLDKLLFFFNSFTSLPNIKIFTKDVPAPKIPSAVFLINPYNIKEPVLEVSKIGLPLLGVVDSDNPFANKYTYPIPANDDSFITIRLFLNLVGLSVLKGIKHTQTVLWNTRLTRKAYFKNRKKKLLTKKK